MDKSLDRRFHQRKESGQKIFAVEIWSPDHEKMKNLRLIAQGINISSGGVGIVVPYPLWEGDFVKIEYPGEEGGRRFPDLYESYLV